jgi:DNA-binding transcriptional LysR family regulator
LCGRLPQNCEGLVFDWNDLRHFLAVARTGSMGAAARSLSVNQSTVQRRLAALEEELGCELVERGPRGYSLTADGQRLLAHAEQVEAAANAVQRHAIKIDDISAHVRVASLVTVGQRIMRSGLIERFHAQYPAITIEMVLGQGLVDLAKGEADIAIRGGGPASNALVGRKIAELPWGAYASRAFIERYGQPGTVAELEHFGVIELVGEIEKLPAARWMKRHAGRARIVAQCDNIPSAHLAVKSGAGIAMLPSVHAKDDVDLVRVLGPIAELKYPIYLFMHRDLRKVRRVRAVFDFCVRELRPVLMTGTMRT